MGIRRIPRSALALGLLACLLSDCQSHCRADDKEGVSLPSTLNDYQAAGEKPFLSPPSQEFGLSGRPSPFYDGDAPRVVPRQTHAQRIPTRRGETPATISSQPDPREIRGELETAATQKTPLPESDFTDTAEPASTARGRSGFGSSGAWALGILAAGWLARQFLKSGGALSMGPPSSLELLSRQSIGPQQQLALIRLGQRILLVGTTPTGMSTLATVDDPAEVQAIVAELRPSTTQVGPTLLDLFRSRRSEPTRDSAPASVSLSTHRRAAPPVNREVADV